VFSTLQQEQASWQQQVKQLMHSLSPKSRFLFQKGQIIASGVFYVTETEYVPSFLISWRIDANKIISHSFFEQHLTYMTS
jgi:hypothetical protein